MMRLRYLVAAVRHVRAMKEDTTLAPEVPATVGVRFRHGVPG
jgi:hypothetical protein